LDGEIFECTFFCLKIHLNVNGKGHGVTYNTTLVVLQVRSHLQAGVIHPVVDQALGNQFNVESMWKVAEIAMRSVEPYGAHRPTMMQVVADLREAMEIEENANPSNLANPTHQTISRTLLGGNFTSHESLDHMMGDNSLTPSGSSKVDIDSGPHAR